MKNHRKGIVIHGGAIKGAFAAGVVYGISKIGIQTADMIVGTSSSVPTAAYFASKQFEFIRNIWVNEVGTKEFIGYANFLTGKPIFNLRYLIDVVFKRKYPLDVKSIIKSNSLFLIPLYNYLEGKVEFINNHQEKTERDFWKILQAAMTIHNEHIIWGNPLEKFVDADLDPFAFYRQEVIPENWNVLLVVNHKDLENTFKRWAGVRIFRLLQSRHFPGGVKAKLKIRGELIKSGFELFEKFKKKYQPIVISPSPSMKLAISALIIRDKNKLASLFERGVKTVADTMVNIETKQGLEIFIARSNELANSREFLQPRELTKV